MYALKSHAGTSKSVFAGYDYLSDSEFSIKNIIASELPGDEP